MYLNIVITLILVVFTLIGCTPSVPIPPPGLEFTGVSNQRSVQEALADALQQLDQAMAAQGIADNMATWKVVETTGRIGGIAGFNELHVKISATFLSREGEAVTAK